MSTKRSVVPGGTGFLGRALTERLTARGDRVIILTRGRLVAERRYLSETSRLPSARPHGGASHHVQGQAPR